MNELQQAGHVNEDLVYKTNPTFWIDFCITTVLNRVLYQFATVNNLVFIGPS